MSLQGTATIDFGAFPGKSDVSLDVSSPTITSTSLVEAWVFPASTVDHTVDEHLVEPPRVIAGNVQAGVGFTIYAFANIPEGMPSDSMTYGTWNVAWVWN